MNWYKISQENNSVEDIAKRVRSLLVGNNVDDDVLRDKCLPVSRHLARVLIDNGYNAANVVQGVFKVDNPSPSNFEEWGGEDFQDMYTEDDKYNHLHYWVQLNHIVVDITADQFNDELNPENKVDPVTIGEISSLKRYKAIMEDFIEPRIMYPKIASVSSKKIYIMSGISGSGKSTAARNLPGVKESNIYSTDDLVENRLKI